MTPRNDKTLLKQAARTIRNAYKRGELTPDQIAALENADFKFNSQLAKTPCTDHTGQEFPSISAMCRAWGITISTYYGRIKYGWTLEQALSGYGPDSKRDHTGRLFPSQKAMCEAWGVGASAYRERLKQGCSVEEALTKNHKGKIGPKPCTDHLGHEYPSITAMCKHWGLESATYKGRIANGWSVKEALTGKREKKTGSKNCTDHLGQQYPSIKAMCEAWGVCPKSYRDRIKYGWTLEQALTGNRKKKTGSKSCTDHLGQKFPSIKAMCRAWGVNRDTYSDRIKHGWTLEEALTGKREMKYEPNRCTDHLGQEFPSVNAMCRAWGVSERTYRRRRAHDWSLEEALTSNQQAKTKPKPCKDHLGQEFPSVRAMCKHWGTNRGTYRDRIKYGWSIEEALTGNRETKTGPRRCTDHLGQEFPSVRVMCRAWGIDASMYRRRTKRGWSVEEALTGNRKENGGAA